MGCSSSIPRPASMKEDVLLDEYIREDDFFDSYCLGPKLGQGSFGQVRAAIGLHDAASDIIAVKVATYECHDDELAKKKLHRDIDAWRAIPYHRNVVSLRDVFFNFGTCFMIMERCSCNFIHHLETLDELNECILGKILNQMLQAISHLHDARYVHRDIKADNFLIAQDGHTIKLCDFGLSVSLPESGLLRARAGTAPFMCPEMLRGCGYNEKADLWSLGVLAYALFFRTFPYAPEKILDGEEASKAMHIAILSGAPPKFHSEFADDQMYSQMSLNFVRSLMNREYQQRPSAQEALQSTYIVMSQNSYRAEEVALSTLHSMLESAKKEGTFDDVAAKHKASTSTSTSTSTLDSYLQDKHKEKHGSPIPTSLAQMEIQFAPKAEKGKSASSIVNSFVSTDAGSAYSIESPQTSFMLGTFCNESLQVDKYATSFAGQPCKFSL